MCGKTLGSGIEVARAYMSLFNVNQLTTHSRVVAGFEELQPDSWSVKVSLLHVRPEERPRFLNALRGVVNSCLPRYPEQLRGRIIKYASDAAEAKSSTEAHKYVLLNESYKADPEHQRLMEALAMQGLGKVGSDIQLIPAPLLRSTHSGGALLTPMPYTYKGAYDVIKGYMSEVIKVTNTEDDPDPDLDLAGHEKPKWTMYSLRRAGERSARNNQKRHGLPRDEIDLYSGWDLSEHSRDMQLHYAGQDRQHRIKRCDITRWI